MSWGTSALPCCAPGNLPKRRSKFSNERGASPAKREIGSQRRTRWRMWRRRSPSSMTELGPSNSSSRPDRSRSSLATSRTNRTYFWQEAVQFAELGQLQEAIARGEAAIRMMQMMGKPDAGMVRRASATLSRAGDTGLGLYEPNRGATGPAQAASSPRGPGLLRMAASAAGAMAKFLGSGMKTTPPDVAKQRLQICRTCEHHTGVRCRVCGCFTGAKSKMLHERCPIDKWPA